MARRAALTIDGPRGDWLFTGGALSGAILLAASVGLFFRRPAIAGLAVFVLFYIIVYGVLSRRGYAEARAWNVPGFYYLTPSPTHRWEARNYGLVHLFGPINQLEQWLGLGMGPASAPLWGLTAAPDGEPP